MENDLCYESKQYQKLVGPIDISKNPLLKLYVNSKVSLNLDDLDLRSVSTHKNSADSLNSLNSNREKNIPFSPHINELSLKQNLTNIYIEEQKKRRDNFGKEIKKGGKHKITFADDLDIIKSLSPEKGKKNIIRKSMRFNSNFPSKNVKYSLPEIKQIKRSNSFINDRSSLKNIIYNILKIKTKSNKKFKENFVYIIDVENLKKENKLNTFSIKNRTALAEEENVSCSCYCSIW